MNGVGMDECDLEAEEALARTSVDQLRAGGRQTVELSVHVLDLVSDVVHAWSALGEELPHRRLLAERREQLDAPGADAHRRGLDALVVDRRAVLELGAEEALVGVDRLVEVVDGDAEVVDAADLHGSDATRLVLDGPDRTDGLGGP